MKREIYKHRNLKKALLMLTLAGGVALNPSQAQTLENLPQTAKEDAALQLAFREVSNLKFRIEVTQPFQLLHDDIRVYILSNDRQILYANTYSHHALRITTFDLSTLQDGTYGFEVRSGSKRVTQLFDIKTKSKRVVLARND
ncbi:hypothetical protein [Larkinella humicola]|uniref:Secreted protein (Por secretion system target) n=1 Tax=Larkinella humicola TaxID=2607654 RepID=A0A5N1JHC0_9BACT|nr:hypothetical protein [Larkinella humicola]KAA9352731.1 hypothetical protein F0P93_16200 [Larkinella humicola]